VGEPRADRAAAEELIESWQKEYGGPGAASSGERWQFPLTTVFAVMAIVAVVAATSRLFGADLRGFISAASIWFWILLFAASMWAVFFKRQRLDQEDVGPTPR
jgi:purine-cytosine permease-like protein